MKVLKPLVISIGIVSLFGGCSATPTPDQVQLPHTPEQYADFTNYINNKLEGEEQVLAQEFLSYSPYGESYAHAFMKAQGNNKIIKLADIIADQRAINIEWEDTQRQMHRAIEVVYINHKPISPGYDFRLKLRNKQNTPIDRIDGQLVFHDANNQEKGRIDLRNLTDIPANETVYRQLQLDPSAADSYDKDALFRDIYYIGYFKDGEYSSSQVHFEPTFVEFKDGNKLRKEQVDLLAIALR